MDLVGGKRLSTKESNNFGLLRIALEIRPWVTVWGSYHYNTVWQFRQFRQGKGFDPGSQRIMHLLGLGIIEM
jgi:hypothetical protein